MKVLYLDESGDHNLAVIDPQYPVFVLGGVIVDQDYVEGRLASAIDQFKWKMFGRTDIVLHTADITRNRNGFERLKDSSFRDRFYEELNLMKSELEYTVVACAVRKDEHLASFGVAALDPYLLSLDTVVEQFCFCLDDEGEGVIVAEMRGPTLDRQIELAWLNLKIQGTKHIQAVDLERRIKAFNLRAKSSNLAGLQLADLVVSPIGRYVTGRPAKADWKIVREKIRADVGGQIAGYGLVTLPK
jgi:hypothetical protein